MKKKIKIIFIYGFIIICFIIIAYYKYLETKPLIIFQKKFGFQLPESAKVVNYKFEFIGEEILYLKILFDKNDYKYIEEKLDIYFKGSQKNDPFYVLSDYVFSSDCPWWDMNENKLLVSYFLQTFGKRAKTRDVFAYITVDENEQYYLYVIH